MPLLEDVNRIIAAGLPARNASVRDGGILLEWNPEHDPTPKWVIIQALEPIARDWTLLKNELVVFASMAAVEAILPELQTPPQPGEVSPEEQALIDRMAEINVWTELKSVTRQSDRLFDIVIEGQLPGASFSAWLPLSTIAAADWARPAIWGLNDAWAEEGRPQGYTPQQGVDWSGIQGSSEDQIWKMFEIARFQTQ